MLRQLIANFRFANQISVVFGITHALRSKRIELALMESWLQRLPQEKNMLSLELLRNFLMVFVWILVNKKTNNNISKNIFIIVLKNIWKKKQVGFTHSNRWYWF